MTPDETAARLRAWQWLQDPPLAMDAAIPAEILATIEAALKAAPPPEAQDGWQWHHHWQSDLIHRDGWMCEKHPGEPWPECAKEVDCPGPGMPWLIAGKENIRAALAADALTPEEWDDVALLCANEARWNSHWEPIAAKLRRLRPVVDTEGK